MHPRATIRRRVAELVAAALPGVPVHRSRIRPWQSRELPACGVYTMTEDAERDEESGRYERTLRLAVELVARQPEDLDDELDELAGEAEDALLRDPSLGGLPVECAYAGAEATYRARGDQVAGGLRLSFSVTYASEHVPDLAGLDDFNTADMLWTPDGADSLSPAVQDIVHPNEEG